MQAAMFASSLKVVTIADTAGRGELAWDRADIRVSSVSSGLGNRAASLSDPRPSPGGAGTRWAC